MFKYAYSFKVIFNCRGYIESFLRIIPCVLAKIKKCNVRLRALLMSTPVVKKIIKPDNINASY